jgi:hypothetical protein
MLGASDEFPTCPDILAENGGASPDLGPRKPPLSLFLLLYSTLLLHPPPLRFRRMLGSNQGQLRLCSLLWLSDALTTQLDRIHSSQDS